MKLAEKGNNLNVDMTNEDATASKASESKHGQSLYSAMHDMDPRPVFLWGQAVGKNLCKLTFSYDMDLRPVFLWVKAVLKNLSNLTFSHNMDPRPVFPWGQTTRPKIYHPKYTNWDFIN